MRFTTDRLERLQRSLELAVNQEWPQLSATQKALSRLQPNGTPIVPMKAATALTAVAAVATDGGENRLRLEPLQVQIITMRSQTVEVLDSI